MGYSVPLLDSEMLETSIVFYSALVSTCGIGAQLQSRGRLRQDELKSLGSLWKVVIDDRHLYKLVPLPIEKMQYLCRQKRFISFKT